MKRINSWTEIDFSTPATPSSITYVLPKGVLIHVTLHPNGRIGMCVTNASYSPGDFHGKSFGSNYEKLEWFKSNLDYWVKQSEI